MRRQRARARAGQQTAAPVAIGVQMLRVGEQPPAGARGAVAATPDLGIWVTETSVGPGTCRWLVVLLGADDSEVSWSLTGVAAFFDDLPADGPAQLVYSESGSAEDIRVYATQNGITVQSDFLACLV